LRTGNSTNVWNAGGELCAHSKLVTVTVSVNVLNNSGAAHSSAGAGRLAANPSYITYMNTNNATNDMILPNELTAFHPANPSA